MKSKITNIKSIFTYDLDSDSIINLDNKELLIDNGVIVDIDDKISYDKNIIDANGYTLTPGFIDCHTHPVFIGNRANEFQMRCSGKNYQDIANQGGGINSSVKSLRSAEYADLYNSTIYNIKQLISNGSTTIESKSGYGLSVKDEIKSLKIINEINNSIDANIIPTFMGAHAFPSEYADDHCSYIDLICKQMIPEIKKQNLSSFCDVFCEDGYFDINQTKEILKNAIKHGMKIKIHVDEFVDIGGINLAVEMGAISVDHLMNSNNHSIDILSKSDIVGVLLPGTSFCLGGKKYANGRSMIDSGCKIALATDFNAGSCTITSLPFVMLLSMLHCGLTIDETIVGVTYNAAKALSIENEVGIIKEGYKADILFWDIDKLIEIPYWFGQKRLKKIMINGRVLN